MDQSEVRSTGRRSSGSLTIYLFVNDLTSVVKSSSVMYADDVKIDQQISSPFDCDLLQIDISDVCKRSADWRLTPNTQKSLSFTTTLKLQPCITTTSTTFLCSSVAEIRDLGVLSHRKLTFSAHVSSVATKTNRALGLLIRSFKTGLSKQKFDLKALLTAYFANVKSIIEYGGVVWSGAIKTHLKRLERVQHKFLI